MVVVLSYFLLVLLLYGEVQSTRYDGSQVYRLIPKDNVQLQTLNTWMHTMQEFDFWKEPSIAGNPVDIRIDAEQIISFKGLASAEGFHEPLLIISDVQALIDRQIETNLDHDATRYYNLSQITEFLYEMEEECNLNNGNDCSVITIGTSYEDRELNLIKVGRAGGNRTGVWIDCGIHAREWISPAVCQYVIARLVEESDADSTALRDLYDWYIHPSVNVDGYEYTWTTDRMWRKTRKPNPGSDCVGVDGNRNFDIGWGGTGSSENPCSETYKGTEPFSEVEIRALDDFLTPIGGQFHLALTFHSYGQFFVYPWGYTADEDPDNIDDLADVGQVGEDAINAIHNTGYTGRRSNGDMAGNTIDWAKQKAGIPYSYLFEVRDDGEYGFLLPPELIEPTCEEIWAGVKAMAFRINEIEEGL